MCPKIQDLFQYHALGWHLCPCSHQDKHPLPHPHGTIKGGWYGASDDTGKWITWAKQYPDCLWGVLPIGFAVLDADFKHEGLEALEKLEAQYGKLPPTPCVATGGGGRHYYFSVPENFECGGKKLRNNPGLELISGTKGVVIPPSIHPLTKVPYKWLVHPSSMLMAPLPSWVKDEAFNASGKPHGAGHGKGEVAHATSIAWDEGFEALNAIPSGQRNHTIPRTIIQEKLAGTTEDECRAKAMAWRLNFAPDYSEREIFARIKSMLGVTQWCCESGSRSPAGWL